MDAAGSSGLIVTWDTAPVIPSDLSADLTVSFFHVRLSSVRVIGDAGPGDLRTTRNGVDLLWTQDDTAGPTTFPEAPPGLYSSIDIGVGSSYEQLEIKGRVRVAGVWKPYEIEDEAPMSTSRPLTLSLEPGHVATIPMHLDVAAMLAAVPWDQVPDDGGTLVLEHGSPLLVPVRAAFLNGISTTGTGVQ